jgi:hypothetical protein
MAKLIPRLQFGNHLEKLQGKRSASEFERDTGIARLILTRLKSGAYFPTVEVLDKLNMEIFYRDKETPCPDAAVLAKKTQSRKLARKDIATPLGNRKTIGK